ncbi:MAG: enoyl-CoA hydratase-related protein [Spongiibacter sp.]|nr:enoyl-CoA hydratase-related protein [Spongiibacter sp.]
MSQFESISFEKSNGIATITLNRPDAAHSVDLQMAQELMKAAIICDTDKDIRAVVLTASGKMFCAGGDVASFHSAGAGVDVLLKEITGNLHAANSRFARMRAPLIVAVNGTCAGAGFSLAISGDVVLCSDKAKFTSAYTALGVSPDGSSTHLLPKLVGLRRAQELYYTNRVLSAQEALDWGLVTRVVPADELTVEAEKLAAQMAAGPTEAYGRTKELLLTTYSNSLETQLELESRGIAYCGATRDGQEGISAFAEKRKPTFKG